MFAVLSGVFLLFLVVVCSLGVWLEGEWELGFDFLVFVFLSIVWNFWIVLCGWLVV